MAVRPASFEQRHRIFAPRTQSVGKNAPRRARTDHNKIERRLIHVFPLHDGSRIADYRRNAPL
ncbi:hypothetical protein GALL_396660 [mine drainage metagenome]|uniref:Uncharacterized protein n=1 Tax=mine drainage metagenome TaxID=410659 RepID=A0A1J5QF47_9ZZZZ